MSTSIRTAIVCLLLILVAHAGASAAITRTFSSGGWVLPTDDVRVREKWPDSNVGTDNIQIYTSSNTLGYASNNPGVHWNECPILQFDLPINQDWVITSVSLAEFRWNGTHNVERTYGFYRLVETFDETTATWNNRPARDSSQSVQVTAGPDSYSHYYVDLDPLLLANGSASTFGIQFQLAGTPYPNWTKDYVYSKEANSWARPALRYIFTAEFTGDPSSIPEPATLSLVGLGLVGLVRRLRRRA